VWIAVTMMMELLIDFISCFGFSYGLKVVSKVLAFDGKFKMEFYEAIITTFSVAGLCNNRQNIDHAMYLIQTLNSSSSSLH
jgi:hypothetical protein